MRSDAVAATEAVEDADLVLALPKSSTLEPTIALRRWATFSEIHNQYLYWQWPALNPQEIATVRSSLADLLARNDPLGMLIGLSLATARDVSDVLARDRLHELDRSPDALLAAHPPRGGCACGGLNQGHSGRMRPFSQGTRAKNASCRPIMSHVQ